MVKWSLHPKDRAARRLRLRPWSTAEEESEEKEGVEDLFNPEAAAVDPNPFPTELMSEDDAAAVAEEVQLGAAVEAVEPEPEVEEAVEPEPEVEEVVEPEPTYDSMTVPQLQDLLRERGLTVSGVKAELITRLEADDAGPSEESEALDETAEAPSEEAVSSDEMPEEGEVSESGGTE